MKVVHVFSCVHLFQPTDGLIQLACASSIYCIFIIQLVHPMWLHDVAIVCVDTVMSAANHQGVRDHIMTRCDQGH